MMKPLANAAAPIWYVLVLYILGLLQQNLGNFFLIDLYKNICYVLYRHIRWIRIVESVV